MWCELEELRCRAVGRPAVRSEAKRARAPVPPRFCPTRAVRRFSPTRSPARPLVRFTVGAALHWSSSGLFARPVAALRKLGQTRPPAPLGAHGTGQRARAGGLLIVQTTCLNPPLRVPRTQSLGQRAGARPLPPPVPAAVGRRPRGANTSAQHMRKCGSGNLHLLFEALLAQGGWRSWTGGSCRRTLPANSKQVGHPASAGVRCPGARKIVC